MFEKIKEVVRKIISLANNRNEKTPTSPIVEEKRNSPTLEEKTPKVVEKKTKKKAKTKKKPKKKK